MRQAAVDITALKQNVPKDALRHATFGICQTTRLKQLRDKQYGIIVSPNVFKQIRAKHVDRVPTANARRGWREAP
jgi:hypothetical protein